MKYLIIFCFAITPIVSIAQVAPPQNVDIPVTAEDGRKFILKANGSWMPKPPLELKTPENKIVVLYDNGTWSYKTETAKAESPKVESSKTETPKAVASVTTPVSPVAAPVAPANTTTAPIAPASLEAPSVASSKSSVGEVGEIKPASTSTNVASAPADATATTAPNVAFAPVDAAATVANVASVPLDAAASLAAPVAAAIPASIAAANSTAPAKTDGSVQTVKGQRVNYEVSYDATKWHLEKSNVGDFLFELTGQNVYAMTISGKVNMSMDKLESVAISNAKSQAPDLKVTNKTAKVINGKEICALQMEGSIEGMPFTFYGYLFAGQEAAVQFIAYTVSKLFDSHKPEMESLLNSLVIASK